MTLSFSQSSPVKLVMAVFSITFVVLAVSGCVHAQVAPNDYLKTTSTGHNNYPPIVPSSISSSQSSLTSKSQVEQNAILTANINNNIASNSSNNIAYHPITPATSPVAGEQQPLVLSVSAAKNPVIKGQKQILDIAVFDANSRNQIPNATINGIVFDPSKNSIKNQFSGISNTYGTYSYTWTIPKNSKSQTYEVRVNASSTLGSYYNYAQKPPITTFDVKGSSGHIHNSQSDSSRHHHNGNQLGENLANSIINKVRHSLGM